MVNIMNNEQNQNIIQNQQNIPMTAIEQQPQTLAQIVKKANEKTHAPVDFESLSPLEKQQLIDKAIKEAEMKCKVHKPKGWNGLIFTCVVIVLLCIACFIVLNTLT